MNSRLLVFISIFTAATLCAGCATPMHGGTDWYSIGARDGRLGASPQDDYMQSRFSTPADRELYRRGWEAGYAQRPGPAV